MTIRVYTVVGLLLFIAGLWVLVLRRQFESLQQRDQTDGTSEDPEMEMWSAQDSTGDPVMEGRDIGIALTGIGLALIIISLFHDTLFGVD